MATTYFPPNEDAPTIAPLVGKRYYTRDGARTTPLVVDDCTPNTYLSGRVGDFARSWFLNGAHARGNRSLDIIAEVGENAPQYTRPTIAPAAGKRYLMRNGEGVGPMRFRGADEDHPWIGFIDVGVSRTYTAIGRHSTDPQYDLVAEVADTPTAEGPVRRRTVTEIVPGTYGRLEVNVDMRGVWLSVSSHTVNATELRAAAATLSALADALDEMGGAS